MFFKIKNFTFERYFKDPAEIEEVVVAQVVELWHSVWASWAELDFGFFSVQNCWQSILTGCRAFSNNV